MNDFKTNLYTNSVLNVDAICWRANNVFTLDILIAWQQSTTTTLKLLIEKSVQKMPGGESVSKKFLYLQNPYIHSAQLTMFQNNMLSLSFCLSLSSNMSVVKNTHFKWISYKRLNQNWSSESVSFISFLGLFVCLLFLVDLWAHNP